MKYIISGVEEVYDAFDEFEHENKMADISINAGSLEEAIGRARTGLQKKINKEREGFTSSGMFIARVTAVKDEKGETIYANELIRSDYSTPSENHGVKGESMNVINEEKALLNFEVEGKIYGLPYVMCCELKISEKPLKRIIVEGSIKPRISYEGVRDDCDYDEDCLMAERNSIDDIVRRLNDIYPNHKIAGMLKSTSGRCSRGYNEYDLETKTLT